MRTIVTYATSACTRRLAPTVLFSAAVLFFALAFTAPFAQAKIMHAYESVITEVPAAGPGGPVPAPGPLEEVSSMAVFSGDLYVAEHIEREPPSISRTDQFAPSASKPGEYEFVSQSPSQPEPTVQNRADGISFGSAAGELEMYLGQGGYSSAGGVNVFAAGLCGNLECATFQTLWTGAAAPSPFAGVSGVAVDHSTSPGDWASGDVFVAAGTAGGESVADIFEPQAGGEEHYVEQVTGPSPGQPFDSSPGHALSVAVSGFNGDLVASDGDGVYLFRPEEEGVKKGKYVFERQIELPGAGPLTGVGALAVDDSNGEIYTATRGAVYEFGPECAFRGSISGVPKEGTPSGVKGQAEEVPFGPLPSLAVDPVSHRVFVGQASGLGGPPEVVDVFGPDAVAPDVVTEAPSNLALETDPQTAAVSWGVNPTGSVNPLNEGEASCGFAWGLTQVFGQEAPCSASGLQGGSPVPVHGSLTGLEPDTAYFYRLHAKNEHAANPGEASETYRFTTPGPGLHGESVSDVASSSATFEATIAPHDTPSEEHDLQAPVKTPTSYSFQYNTQGTGVCTAEPGACTSVPSSPVSVGSGAGDVNVSQHTAGLSANTTYHYRLVAVHEALPESKPGVLTAFYGPDQTFTTQGAGGPLVLPDGRAWELVSPVDLHGAQLELEPNGFAAAGGGQFTFRMNGPTEAATPGNPTNGVQVLSTRTAPGVWSSVDIALSRSQPEGIFVEVGQTPEFRWFSEDLGLAAAVYRAAFSVPEGWHQNELGEWEHFVESSPVPSEATPYLRHNTTCAVAPASCYEPLLDTEDVTSGVKYGGEASLDGETPDGSHLIISSSVQLTRTTAPEGGLYEWSAEKPPAERLSLVSVTPGGEPVGATRLLAAVAADGSRVFFTGGGASYMRDMLTETTVPLPGFAAASSDGSRVLAGGEVYEVNDEGARGIASESMVAKIAGGGFELVGASRDLSSVYFIDAGVLPGKNAEGREPQAGADNLYVSRYDSETREWATMFIASPPGGGNAAPGEGRGGQRMSPDGRWLAFESEASLTGYDNNGRCVPILNGVNSVIGYKFGPCQEVYLYDAGSGSHPPRLVCVSCNPSGARPVGHSSFIGRGRALFDTGRLFFNSGDALVPQDINGNTDVYEYEPAGVGGCTPAGATFNASTGGCVGLISSGVASGPAEFLGASVTGADVFFSTGERLVPRDVDNLIDVYDAHECTSSSPCAAPSESSEECRSAGACRSAPEPQPSIFGAPPSALFNGIGNLSGGVNPPAKSRSVVEIRVERLSKALASCRHRYKHRRKRRAACDKQAREAYGAAKQAKQAGKFVHANRRAGQ